MSGTLILMFGISPIFVYSEEGVNEFTRQPSNGLKINRQLSRKVIFCRQASKMQNKINRQKVSEHFNSHSVSADL